MIKKILSALLTLSLVLTVASTAMAASSFTDVPSPAYDWAIPDIEAMTRNGIIKGYSDQTFKPANPIKKIEMLLLMARAAEFENDDYAPFVEFATDLYSPVMNRYDLGETYNKYKPEVSFLLYKGIISINELDSLIGDEQANTPVKRYEAAVLLTKLMGAEAQAQSNIAPVLDYTDFTSIPANARAYVEYVSSQGIMGDVGDNKFGPNDSVTRAQVAVILSRILSKLDYSVRVGTVRGVNPDAGYITLYNSDDDSDTTFPVNFRSAKVTLDGYPSSVYGIARSNHALLLYSGDTVVAVEVLSSINDMAVVGGILEDITTDDSNDNYDTYTLTVRDQLSDMVSEYDIYSDELPQIFLSGRACGLEDLEPGNIVMLTLSDGEVVSVSASPNTGSAIGGFSADDDTEFSEFSGIITNIEFTPDYVISVLLSDETLTDFIVSGTVTITRNGNTAGLRDLLVGDSVEIIEEDGLVSEISATSTSGEASGVLYSIFISSAPELGVKNADEENVYPVAPNAEYEVDGSEATIYDLRLGANVELDLEGSSVVRVISSSEAATRRADGLIIDFNESYGFLVVENSDGGTEQVFLAMDGTDVYTSIIDSATGERIDASDLDAGMHIIAIGTYTNGNFLATTVVILPD